jgi:hypothetical protein
LAYRGDAGQGLSSKAKGGNTLQVLYISQFAGGMAGKGKDNLILRDSAAVVGNTDETTTSLANLDANICGSSVDAVLEQFLHHRCWSLDNLTGSNLARHFRR